MPSNNDQLKVAHQFIGLLQSENAQLHGVVRLLGQLVDDMGANCSYEVFEMHWEAIKSSVDRLSTFFASHQKALKSLQDDCPAVWDADEVDES